MKHSDTIDGLPPVGQMVRDYGLIAHKSMGQHFLFDFNLMRKIARSAGPLEDKTIVEIGAGPGGLTRSLLVEGAEHVIVIEKDKRAIPLLSAIADHHKGRLTIIHDDALKINIQNLLGNKTARVVANLPYNIGTELLLNWLSIEPWGKIGTPWYDKMILMFQREVAQRICAPCNDTHYGRLAILSQIRCNCEILFDVNPAAFHPPPKIWSSVIEMRPILGEQPCIQTKLSRVTAAAFGQRRKMLRTSLKSVFDKPTEVLNSLGIDPESRAETLQIKDFVRLANLI